MKSVIAKKQVLIVLSICFFIATMLVSTFLWNLGQAMWESLKTFPEFSKPIEFKVSYWTDFHFKEQTLYYGIAALIGFVGIAHMIYKLRSNFKPVGTDEKGSQRFATRKEIQQQYKAIPDRKQPL